MKIMKLFQYICIPMLSLGLLLLPGCSSKEFDEVTDVNLTRCLEPMNLGAKVSSTLGDVVTFSWDVTKDAESYLLTICNDADMTDVYLTESVSTFLCRRNSRPTGPTISLYRPAPSASRIRKWPSMARPSRPSP